MSSIQQLAAIALHEVTTADDAYFIRRAMRAYSRNFHTPLSAVEELPLEYVLQTYFEMVYEEKTEEERLELARILSETPAEFVARKKAEEDADDDYAREVEAEARAAAKSPTKDEQAPIVALEDTQEIVTPEDLQALADVPELRITFDAGSNLDLEGEDLPSPD